MFLRKDDGPFNRFDLSFSSQSVLVFLLLIELPKVFVIQRLMGSFGIIKVEPIPDSFSGLPGRIVFV